MFEQAEKKFKKQTRESMTREYLSNEEVWKMLPPKKVFVYLLMITFGYKAVDAYVK